MIKNDLLQILCFAYATTFHLKAIELKYLQSVYQLKTKSKEYTVTGLCNKKTNEAPY